jgi:hypothetical protein
MKIEEQVTNLELSMKLKELKVLQKSIFYWRAYDIANPFIARPRYDPLNYDYSAFTVAELGEILRPFLKKNIWLRDVIAEAMDNATYMIDEANSRAQMLIYLIENNLLKL